MPDSPGSGVQCPGAATAGDCGSPRRRGLQCGAGPDRLAPRRTRAVPMDADGPRHESERRGLPGAAGCGPDDADPAPGDPARGKCRRRRGLWYRRGRAHAAAGCGHPADPGWCHHPVAAARGAVGTHSGRWAHSCHPGDRGADRADLRGVPHLGTDDVRWGGAISGRRRDMSRPGPVRHGTGKQPSESADQPWIGRPDGAHAPAGHAARHRSPPRSCSARRGRRRPSATRRPGRSW